MPQAIAHPSLIRPQRPATPQKSRTQGLHPMLLQWRQLSTMTGPRYAAPFNSHFKYCKTFALGHRCQDSRHESGERMGVLQITAGV